ncbi:sensor domain-containing diguanylate cyclase [Acidisoma sp. 7E03]
MQDELQDEHGRLAALTRYAILDTAPEGPFDKITGLVRTVLGVPIAAVSLIDRHRQWLKSCVGVSSREMAREISFCTHTIQQREPLVVPDATQDPRFADNPLVTGESGIRSYLGIPLATPDGYQLGALCALDTKPRSFDPLQIQIMTNFAALVMDEMELRLIAESDFLTGAMTRRAFLMELQQALTALQERQEPAALVFYDVDHFKQVNDRLGHEAGDRVLAGVAAAVGGAMPESSVLGRLGGEEFALLLPGYDAARALGVAETLRAAVAAQRFEGLPEIAVSASFGIAPAEAATASPAAWIAAADAAMYAAKEGGRNRCVLAGA